MSDASAGKGALVSALGVAASIMGAIGSGVAQLLHLLPEDIGRLSVIAGLVVSYYYVRFYQKSIIEKDLDIQLKKLKVSKALQDNKDDDEDSDNSI